MRPLNARYGRLCHHSWRPAMTTKPAIPIKKSAARGTPVAEGMMDAKAKAAAKRKDP